MSTTETGRAAEGLACAYLEKQGYAILARNWRTRYHEVDIVASRQGVLHFIEVKYRRSEAFGDGFAYISRDKVRRLQRAALFWVQTERYCGDYQIDAVSITGLRGALTARMIENITG